MANINFDREILIVKETQEEIIQKIDNTELPCIKLTLIDRKESVTVFYKHILFIDN